MPFELVYDDREFLLTLHLEDCVEQQLIQLLRRDESSELSERTRGAMANRISEAISMVVEGHSLPPTEKQVKYAVAIARELSLQLPAEVLQFRDAMTTFLTIHAEHYRRRKGYAAAVPIQ